MINFLISKFSPNSDFASANRYAYGKLSGRVGVIVNMILVAIKIAVGIVTGSISVIGDALNNLSDAGASVVSLVGFKISEMPADEEHPYGHGRFEYLSSFGIAMVILFMGVELLKTSVQKIISPSPISFSWAAVAILLISVIFKLWLALFNKRLGLLIKSVAINAVFADSLCDMAITTAVAASLIIYKFTSISLDGFFGIIVAGFVFYTGITSLKNTITELLGKSPSKEMVKEIEEKIRNYPGIVGVHDFIIHEYGPGRCFVTAHAEVSAETDIMENHDLVDVIERNLKQEYGYNVTLHMDPVVMNDEEISAVRNMVMEIVKKVDNRIGMHDFRMVKGPLHTNLIFDLEVPYKVEKSGEEITGEIIEKVKEISPDFYTVITIDRNYI